MSEFVPESATSKEITVQESIFWTKSNQSVINKTNLKFGNDTKTFWFRFQMDIGMFCPFVFDITNLDSAATPGLTSIDLYPVPPSPGSSYISC